MATYETAMLDDAMFEAAEDTEMAIDAGKYMPHEQDIDIDLDFADHGEQDEMMTEDNHQETTFDLELEDAVPEEQDEEMTDEGSDDHLLDEEITDAPVEHEQGDEQGDSHFVAETEPTNATDLDLESTTQATNEPISSIIAAPITDAATELDEPVINPESTDDSQEAAIENTDASENKQHVEDEHEEISWESDDEGVEEGAEEGLGEDKVGDFADHRATSDHIDDHPTAAATALDTTEGSEENTVPAAIQSAGQDRLSNEEKVGDVDNDETHTENEVVLEGEEIQNLEHEANIEVEDTEVHTVESEDNHENEAQSYPVIDDAKLEQLHPIIVRYMDEEMSLFPPTVEEEHNVFFLGDRKLTFDSCANLFKAFRAVLAGSISESELLVLGCPGLGLEISEGIPEASTLSIAQLLHLYLTLSHNDGYEQPVPFRIILKQQYDVSARLNHLYALVSDGKGLSEQAAQVEEQQDNAEAEADDNTEAGAELSAHDEETLLVEAVQSTVEEPSTPKSSALLYADDGELDFASPAATHKQSGVDRLEGNAEAIPASSKDDQITPKVHDAVQADDFDEITYDEDDVEDENAYEDNVPGGNNVDGNNDRLSDKEILAEQDTTNTNTNKNLSLHQDTNTSISSEGLQDLGQFEHLEESTLDTRAEIDNSLKNPGATDKPVEPYPTTKDTNAPRESPYGTPGSAKRETFEDEIDYSDDDDETLLPATTELSNNNDEVSVKQSPKRSIEEAEESDRDLKKLRST